MTPCASAEFVRALFGCLLVVAASGDDFCLPRLLFPSTLPAAETLPLDDPNTDFVQAEGPAALCRAEGYRPAGPEGLCPAADSSSPAAGRLPAVCASAAARRAPLPEPSPPLRC